MLTGLASERVLQASCSLPRRLSLPLPQPAQVLRSGLKIRAVRRVQGGGCSRLQVSAATDVQEQELAEGEGEEEEVKGEEKEVVVTNTEEQLYNVVFVSSEVGLDGLTRASTM